MDSLQYSKLLRLMIELNEYRTLWDCIVHDIKRPQRLGLFTCMMKQESFLPYFFSSTLSTSSLVILLIHKIFKQAKYGMNWFQGGNFLKVSENSITVWVDLFKSVLKAENLITEAKRNIHILLPHLGTIIWALTALAQQWRAAPYDQNTCLDQALRGQHLCKLHWWSPDSTRERMTVIDNKIVNNNKTLG